MTTQKSESIILITGGSRGIGAATARLAAKQGYVVAINYHNNDQAATTLVADIERAGGRAAAFKADVGNEAEVSDLFKAVDAQLGPLTALVNNAGILEAQARVEDISFARLERIFRTNVMSCFLCAKEAVKRMSTAKGGKGGAIVNVSSRAACLGSANEYVDYAASKGAVDTFTIGLSREVASEGIRVNAVRPGFIYTDMHADGGEPGRVQRLAPSLPMQRGGEPEEVAEAILWLLSDKSSYTTGSFIDVSGGR
jgi:NAD(P)-dependent dehydrogenase (short-subunit alcohol dehydrogenase family)